MHGATRLLHFRSIPQSCRRRSDRLPGVLCFGPRWGAMASKTEGIALLSMYNDEEEEEEVEEEEEEDEAMVVEEAERSGGGEAAGGAEDGLKVADESVFPGAEPGPEKTPPMPQARTPVLQEEDKEAKTLASPAMSTVPTPTRTPTPKHQFAPLSMPSQSPVPAASPADVGEVRRASKRSLTIVDYAHDEMAMSPETEEGEIPSAGRVVIGSDIYTTTEEATSPSMMVLSGTQPTPPRHVGPAEESRSEANTPADILEIEQEACPDDMDVEVSATVQEDIDPLSKFLPPPVTLKCSDELQEKVNKFLAYKRAGKSFNADMRNRKDYRNPNFLQHAVAYQEIDEVGTCFSKDVFDPHGYDKSDYYDAIEADMKREIERREQERKRSPKVDFIAGGTQPAIALPTQKASMQIPVVPSVATGILQSAPVSVDSAPRDGRQSKKSKWDKVDTDNKNPSLPGQDAISSVGVHAAMLSAANAGAGYTAFAQQKRREAEEKKLERKLDKRS